MLDTDTKRRIDTARDILVGKVPDPKSQVEQITIALIYKFMDDMDAGSEELGGKRKFFTGKFARFGWAKLMHSGLSGHETLNLYAEGISKMPENPGIPLLFRNIFKNAYLPYRDPETLKSFLKIIDEFNYDHSERLGDAFEYLLSVLGSQGEAGQFRTPRHIIDFIVEIVNPKKDDIILDPACGTAGFLISSYKHILRANTNARGELKLTPEEKGHLAKNIRGYDISPDMVRLSLVNLYLHGFTDPHIDEYDTLTSEDKWNETADVILANPPFMSPKGGIKPHRRFSVGSNRSEVLFVDYMAEHLTPTGRAGIIVPEGIIFQSQASYVALRKMLVEKFLVAVISLPAGVFHPYSGVKTSILVLDKTLAKRADAIAFFKIENDGFGLGAQRRAIERNDLPKTQAGLETYFHALRNGQSTADLHFGSAQIVSKEEIAANSDYNLGGERYRRSAEVQHGFVEVKLESVCKPEYGFTASAADSGDARFVRITDIDRNGRIRKDGAKYVRLTTESKQYLLKRGDVLVARTGATFGKTMLFDENYPAVFASYLIRLRFPMEILMPQFYWAFAQTEKYWAQARKLATGGGQPQFNGNALSLINIPLPPLDVQKEVVKEIGDYQDVIDGARAVIDHYQPHITVDPSWPTVGLGAVCEDFQNGANFSKEQMGRGTRFVNIKDLFSAGYVDCDKLERVELSAIEVVRKKVRQDDLLFVRSSVKEEGVGFPSLMPKPDEETVFCGFIIKCSPNKDAILPAYLLHLLRTPDFRARVISLSNRANITNISQDSLKSLLIPCPPLATQRLLVEEIEAERELVDANRELIFRFEGKIKAALGRIWGEEQSVIKEADPGKMSNGRKKKLSKEVA